jgi:hypothetical protein
MLLARLVGVGSIISVENVLYGWSNRIGLLVLVIS